MLHRPIIREGLPCQEVTEMPEDVVVTGREVGGIRWVRKGFILQLMESLHRSLRDVWGVLSCNMRIISADNCWMLADKFVVHFMEFSTVTISSPWKDMMDHSYHRPQYQQQHFPWVER